jgi:hypothetical protein
LPTERKKHHFTQREIGEAVNNAVVKALKPAALGEIPETRLRRLRAYSQGAVAAMIRHIEEEPPVLAPEELVLVLTTAALFVQLKYVMRTDKLPLGPLVNEIYQGDEAVVLPERYLQTPEPSDDEILPRMGRPRKK